jgi:hypothetical protein
MDDAGENANGTPLSDPTGDVDLSLIDYCLSLTPAQRLRNGQTFANWILEVRRRNNTEGVECSTPERSTGSNSSAG